MPVIYSPGVLALPERHRRRALDRYLRGLWGKCHQKDHDCHAFRSGILMACYGRIPIVIDEGNTEIRVMLAEEI